ncbi:MAG: DUF1127 domain-containing protein [Alphaproteobacteria bacterium]|nr:MAG: DUF1127 domain-containing protein [Alphaproteobacteria bacterium]
MALFDTTIGGATGTAIPGQSLLDWLASRFQAWQTARETEKALKGLSPHQLADIGIEPGDIEGYAERITRSRY